MERQSTSLMRASKFLPLMAIAQAQVSSAYPYAPRINPDSGRLVAGPKAHFAPNNVVPPEGIKSASWPSTSPSDEIAEHFTGIPVAKIASELDIPASKVAEFSEHMEHWMSAAKESPPTGVLTETEWSTVSTATVTDWPESHSMPVVSPSGEILTSTIWETVDTSTVTNWNHHASHTPVPPVLDASTVTVWSTASTMTIQNRDLTTSESVAPAQAGQSWSNDTWTASSSSAPMALEVSITKTYSQSWTSSTSDVQNQDQAAATVPLFSDAASSATSVASAAVSVASDAVDSAAAVASSIASEAEASASAAAASLTSSPLVYGSITLTWSTHTDTTTGFPATAERVTPTPVTSTQSTIDFYNPNPPSSATQEIVSSAATTSSQSTIDFYNPNPPSSTTQEAVSSAEATSSSSTVDFYNPFPPSSTSEDVTSATPAVPSPVTESSTSVQQESEAPASPVSSSAPSAESTTEVPVARTSTQAPADTQESSQPATQPASEPAPAPTSVPASQPATEPSSEAPPALTSVSASPPADQASVTSVQAPASSSGDSEVTPPSVPDESLTMLSTSAVQTASRSSIMDNAPSTTQLPTSLNTDGRSSVIPFPTTMATSSVVLSLTETVAIPDVSTTSTKLSITVSDIFQPIATDEPPQQLSRRNDHPAPRKGIQPQQKKLQTNKFYSNFFLEDQALPSYTFPYSVVWANGSGATGSYGMAISHTERQQFAGGETDPVTGAWKFYASPLGVHSVILSSTELGQDTQLTTDSLEGFSVNVNLSPRSNGNSRITFPLVQGMGFITARYTQSTPVITSGVGIQTITYVGAVGNNAAHKYRMEMRNGFSWLAYVTPQDSNYDVNSFTLIDGNNVQGPSGFEGTIQVAKIPAETSDAVAVYDSAAGAYPTSASISGSVDGTAGRYTISWQKGGVQSQQLLMFALPHHMQSLSDETKGGVTDVKLMTTVKGNGVAICGDSWTMVENDLPIDMEFAPYQPGYGSIRAVSAEAAALINQAGTAELQQDMDRMSNLDSMYYSGKELAKYAGVVFAVQDMAQNASLAQGGLDRLKNAMARFVENRQQFPLVYENAWGGASSIASYQTGNSGQDFGNTFYNDHHFHYGYHVYAAAVIAYLDPSWLEAGTNKAWVNTLVRDYANSISDDPFFPFSRNFDWYHGHSWAKGLFASADGKDQESSSEDAMASYAIKMWGSVTGDKAMEARGNLMLAIQARSLDNYYLYRDSNEVQPQEYIRNRAAGILFENKIDHTTYFGANIEYIQGINMIPALPFSTITRRRDFVRTEWEQLFASRASSITTGWRGILMANLALVDSTASYDFFAGKTGEYTDQMLDGGASRTWYLAYSAALKTADDAGYESPYGPAGVDTSASSRKTKRWVDGQLVDCDEASQADMEAGVLKMYGKLDDTEDARAQAPKVKRWVDGELVPCDESSQADMEAGVLKMYGELDVKDQSSGQVAPRAVVGRRNRIIGTSGSPRLRQRARGLMGMVR